MLKISLILLILLTSACVSTSKKQFPECVKYDRVINYNDLGSHRVPSFEDVCVEWKRQ